MNRLIVTLVRVTAGALCLGLLASAASADQPDWKALVDIDVIEVLTQDDDGDSRETKVWFVLLGGDPYLRTNGSRWLDNIRRDPIIGLRIEGSEYRVRAEEVPGEAIIEKVDMASKEKYGFQESFIHVFRMRTPQILKLSPMDDPEPASQ